MSFKIKNSKNLDTNREEGFVQVIIVIIIALLIMKYYGITLTEAYNWFRAYFADVLR